MRQVWAFLEKIRVRKTTEEYYHLAFFAKLHRAEMASLEEVLQVGSNESAFDSKTDDYLEQHAKKLLEKKKAMRNV